MNLAGFKHFTKGSWSKCSYKQGEPRVMQILYFSSSTVTFTELVLFTLIGIHNLSCCCKKCYLIQNWGAGYCRWGDWSEAASDKYQFVECKLIQLSATSCSCCLTYLCVNVSWFQLPWRPRCSSVGGALRSFLQLWEISINNMDIFCILN